MAKNEENSLKKSLEDLLSLHGIELSDETSEEEDRELRKGDYSEIIQRTQEKLDELNERAELLYKKLGMTPEEVEAYGSNPNNFSPEQWQALQKVRQEAENFKTRAYESLGQKAKEKDKEQKALGKTRGPHRFGKKKNWIPL